MGKYRKYELSKCGLLADWLQEDLERFPGRYIKVPCKSVFYIHRKKGPVCAMIFESKWKSKIIPAPIVEVKRSDKSDFNATVHFETGGFAYVQLASKPIRDDYVH